MKAEGYCPRCYKRKAVAGKLHCKECEKYYYAYYHAHKAQRLTVDENGEFILRELTTEEFEEIEKALYKEGSRKVIATLEGD